MSGRSSITQTVVQVVVGVCAALVVVWLIDPDMTNSLFAGRRPVIRLEVEKPQVNGPFQPQYDTDLPMLTVEASDSRRMRLQSEPDGLVELGKDLFDSADKIQREFPELIASVTSFADEPKHDGPYSNFERDRPEIAELRKWFRNNGLFLEPRFDDFRATAGRFAALAALPHRTEVESEDLRKLVEKCGRDWLQIPFDEGTRRFDFVNVPSSSPEHVFEKLCDIYFLMRSKSWEPSGHFFPPRTIPEDTEFSLPKNPLSP